MSGKKPAKFFVFLGVALIFNRAYLHLLLPKQARDNCYGQCCQQQCGDDGHPFLALALVLHAAPNKKTFNKGWA